MNRKRFGQGQGSGPVDIQAQLQITHNPAFPFSSPVFDQHSLHSNDSPKWFDSPVSTSPASSNKAFYAKQKDVRFQRKHTMDNGDRDPGRSRKRGTPALQLMTDFSRPIYHDTTFVVDQVTAKHVKTKVNRARSIVSQKGIKSTTSPPRLRREALIIHNKTKHTREKESTEIYSADASIKLDGPHEDSPQRRSVVIGFCVPISEAELHNHSAIQNNTTSLITPATPAIMLTPPDTDMYTGTNVLAPAQAYVRPASSFYSPDTAYRYTLSKDKAPELPQRAAPLQKFRSQNPFRNMSTVQTKLENNNDGRQSSEDSKHHILIHNDESARPKSQGWWNILTSPLLSRGNSLASRKGRETEDIPPVPRIPSYIEKRTPLSAQTSDPSPETPRRQGLANVRESTWSRWTEWEEERSNPHEAHSNGLQDSSLEMPIVIDDTKAGEGLAAEYYHACAIEQLAGIPYFECVSHSCAEHLPKLKSIYDTPEEKGLIILGSPFHHVTAKRAPNINSASIQEVGEDVLVTPIDSEDEEDYSPLIDKKQFDHAKSAIHFESNVEPEELSPNVRKADTAAFVRARMLGSPEHATPLPVYSRTGRGAEFPNIASVVPKSSNIISPRPMSPQARQELAPRVGVPMSNYHSDEMSPPRQFVNTQTSYPELPSRMIGAPIKISDLQPKHQTCKDIEKQRTRYEKEESIAQRAGGYWRGRGCIPDTGCFGRGGREGRKRRRWWICIALLLILIITSCVVLAIMLTRRGTDTPVQSQWLNLTGYPPMPTGISTIARPALTASENRCVDPTTMWSCALPKEDQAAVAPNDPNQPNFRFQIAFRNGTVASNLTIPMKKRANDPFTNDLYTPNPVPPSQAEQVFLGNTTDNVTQPFDGEQTPFFITFMSTSPVLPTAFNTSQSTKRDIQNSIPGPALASDGSAAPATLLPTAPFPISQPIKLYNRGLPDEHYGFYTYYDKSIFLSEVAISNTTANSPVTDPNADQNGGSTKQAANVRCTFSQTRFLVKMFTSQRFGASLLGGPQNITDIKGFNANSSATNFNRPGSFPYPTTIVLDRHGGALNNKLVYCYGMNGGQINVNQRQLVLEDRSFGGKLINAAPGLINTGSGNGFNSSSGGIDGGTGGCGCTWQNWS